MKKLLRIPLVIDANGKWAAYGYTTTEKHGPDWSMVEEVADCDNDLVCPQRYWITVEVELPEVRDVAAAHLEQA